MTTRHRPPVSVDLDGEVTELMQVLIDNLDPILDGFKKTLWLLFFSGLIALVLGTILAAMRVSPVALMRGVGHVATSTSSATPRCC